MMESPNKGGPRHHAEKQAVGTPNGMNIKYQEDTNENQMFKMEEWKKRCETILGENEYKY